MPILTSQVEGMCPLLIAADKNDADIFELCLGSPLADYNLGITNNAGKTALILAVERNNIKILEILLHKEYIQESVIEHQDVS